MKWKMSVVQECRSNEGWQPILVPSSRKDHPDHLVLTASWLSPDEYICDCEGFNYRGQCSHQKLAKACFWRAIDSPEQQDEKQATKRICPRCLGKTRRIMEVV